MSYDCNVNVKGVSNIKSHENSDVNVKGVSNIKCHENSDVNVMNVSSQTNIAIAVMVGCISIVVKGNKLSHFHLITPFMIFHSFKIV